MSCIPRIICSSEIYTSDTYLEESDLLVTKQFQKVRVIFVLEDMNISVLCLVILCHYLYPQLHNTPYHDKHRPISAKIKIRMIDYVANYIIQITSGILSQSDSNQERTLQCSLYIRNAFKSFTAFTYPST